MVLDMRSEINELKSKTPQLQEDSEQTLTLEQSNGINTWVSSSRSSLNKKVRVFF